MRAPLNEGTACNEALAASTRDLLLNKVYSCDIVLHTFAHLRSPKPKRFYKEDVQIENGDPGKVTGREKDRERER